MKNKRATWLGLLCLLGLNPSGAQPVNASFSARVSVASAPQILTREPTWSSVRSSDSGSVVGLRLAPCSRPVLVPEKTEAGGASVELRPSAQVASGLWLELAESLRVNGLDIDRICVAFPTAANAELARTRLQEARPLDFKIFREQVFQFSTDERVLRDSEGRGIDPYDLKRRLSTGRLGAHLTVGADEILVPALILDRGSTLVVQPEYFFFQESLPFAVPVQTRAHQMARWARPETDLRFRILMKVQGTETEKAECVRDLRGLIGSDAGLRPFARDWWVFSVANSEIEGLERLRCASFEPDQRLQTFR